MPTEKLVIVGSGPAGLTAAIYAARANLNPLCFEGFNAGGLIPGGQLMYTTDVENYPGFPEGVLGPKLMKAMRAQAERFGTRFVTQDVTEADLTRRPFVLKSDDHAVQSHAVIIATGARANWLNLENEQRLARSGGGVSACAVCDGALPLFRKQELVVVGGGDSAVEEASYLTKFASKVYIVHRRDTLRASKAMQERAFANPKMEFLWNTEVIEVLGDKKVEGVRIRNVKTGEVYDKPIDGMFLGIGHTPNTEAFTPWIDHDESGYLITTPGRTATKVPGVFACGDAQDHYYRQAITAAGSGCAAAIECERWLEENGGH